MARQEIALKKYVVTLSNEEREHLTALIHSGHHPAQKLLKARILLKADASDGGEGWSDSQIAAALGIFDGAAEARLMALACSKPPAGRARWTLQLLEEAVVELKIVKRASDNTIGRTLKKTLSSRI